MTVFALQGDHITLAQVLKAVGLVESGGQAKQLVRTGSVRVNGKAETHPGRKLVVGDRVELEGGEGFTIGR